MIAAIARALQAAGINPAALPLLAAVVWAFGTSARTRFLACLLLMVALVPAAYPGASMTGVICIAAGIVAAKLFGKKYGIDS